MANSDYEYAEVLAGNGGPYTEGGDTGYSQGVFLVQTFLRNIGYSITADGRYGPSTTEAVKEFQREFGRTRTGQVDTETLKRLDVARRSRYYLSFGHRLEVMGANNIRAGIYDDVDLVARIIYAESGAAATGEEMENDLASIAVVLSNRATTTLSGYAVSPADAPNASIWARVIAAPSQYSTITSQNAMKPCRGYQGNATDPVDPRWKRAVDLADHIVSGGLIMNSGYLVQGLEITDIPCTMTEQMNQVAWSLYESWYNAGLIGPCEVITSSKVKGRTNVICTRV